MDRSRVHALAWVTLVVGIGFGMAASPTPAAAPGTFVWHDLVTDNLATARTFYGELFGWTFEAGKGVDPNYTIIRHNGVPIGGIVVPREPTSPQWLSYVVVANVDRAVDSFRDAGGRIYRGPLNVNNGLRVAAVADAQGAAIGLASRGPLTAINDAVPEINRWLWMDYVARDATQAVDFYSRVLGYTAAVTETRQNVAYYRLTNPRPRAGLFATPWPRETSVWLPYVRVADPEASTRRVQALGGTIVQSPSPRVRNGSLAVVLDPTGAPIALQKYPFDGGATP